jgi:predicted amidohydrolase YtcJ
MAESCAMIRRQPRPPVPLGPPDYVLRNGNIVTLDENHPRAQALAIADGRIQSVGGDAQIGALATSRTEEIDLGGRTVLPGFIDAHAHVSHVGHELGKVDLSRCNSIADVLGAIADRATTTKRGEWIEVSGMWHESALAEQRFPTRRELDSVAPDHPVYLPRGTRFFAVANSLALKLAGIDEHTPAPAGGEFARDPPTGELTGLLLQPPAFSLAKRLLPVPGPNATVEAIRRGGRLFARTGVTSVIDPALSPEAMRAYQELWSAGELQLRTNMIAILDMSVPLSLSPDQLLHKVAAWGPYSGFGDAMLRLGAMKMFVDGFVETAWLKEPYANDPTFHGVQAVPREVLQDTLRAASRNNWQVAVHCVGDAAVDLALDAFEAADQEKSIRDRRWSLIHAVFAPPDAFERASRLGVVISAQQLLVHAFAATMLTCWGEERMQGASPHRAWLDAGLVVAAGSDVVPFDPLLGIWSLVTRDTRASGVVGPAQAVTRAEALRMYTLNAAYLTFEEDLKGSLEPGKLADLVILNGDPLTCATDEIKDLEVTTTILGGQPTHSTGQVWGNPTP